MGVGAGLPWVRHKSADIPALAPRTRGPRACIGLGSYLRGPTTMSTEQQCAPLCTGCMACSSAYSPAAWSVTLHTKAITRGARLKPNAVPAKLFQCSILFGRNKKSSKFICPPTKPTRAWWQNILFASLGGPRWYAYICCPARCHVKKTCFQKQFLLEHHWNTAGKSYLNVAGTSKLQ